MTKKIFIPPLTIVAVGGLVAIAIVFFQNDSFRNDILNTSKTTQGTPSAISETQTDSDIISQGNIHWHPEFKIIIKGEEFTIPANVGLGTQYAQNPLYDSRMGMTNMHTHDGSGKIHWEVMQGPVKKGDVRFGNFFSVWEKTFNENCIFDNCNGPDGNVRMTVNGTENTEFENYLVKDGDKIEIIFE